MDNKTKRRIIFFLSIILTCFIISPSNAVNIKNTKNLRVDSYGSGFLEEREGIKILYLNGSYYEIGYQQGVLLKEDIIRSYKSWFYSLEESGVSKDDLLDIWNRSKTYIPKEYKQEMQGISDGAEIPFEDVAAISVLGIGIYFKNRCSFFSVWGNATKDGKLYHVHSSDWDLGIIDPVTGTYEVDRQLIVVRKINDGFSSVCSALPGTANVEEGINEKGIVISYTNVLVDDYSKEGIPMSIRMRMVLDTAECHQDAFDIMRQNKVCGKNFLISDGNIPVSYVMEQDANDSCISTWNDPVETYYPSWTIENVIRRGNFFLKYNISGVNEEIYKKSSLIRYLLVIFGFDIEYFYYYVILHYLVLSKEVERNWGDFDLNLSMNTLRNTYLGKTNLFYGLLNKLGATYSNSWSQVVYCPETGDILISFARDGKTAFKQNILSLNFDELMSNF